MKKHRELSISGKVQGVGFRYEAKEQADNLNICGYATNLRDGSVVIELEGEDAAIGSFIDWCRTGSHLAMVERIETKEGDIKGFREFQIY